jgi:hypothetical protein
VAPSSVKDAPSLTEVVAQNSVEVAPEIVVPGSEEDARLNPALNSVAVSAGDLLSMDWWWSTMGLVEDVLLVGAEETHGGGEREGRRSRGGRGGKYGRGGRRGGGWGRGGRFVFGGW